MHIKLKTVIFRLTLLTLFTFSNYSVAEDSIAFIFSGYKSSPKKELYQQIGATFEMNGVHPVFVEIDWSTGSIPSYIEQGKNVVKNAKGDKNYFYGFSLGGLIALSLSAEISTESVLASSVAPFFKEDIEALSWYSPLKLYNWWNFGKSESISVNNLLDKLNSKNTEVILLVGDNERKIMLNRSSYISDNLKNGKLVIMNDMGHGISEPGHMKYIITEIKRQMPNRRD